MLSDVCMCAYCCEGAYRWVRLEREVKEAGMTPLKPVALISLTGRGRRHKQR